MNRKEKILSYIKSSGYIPLKDSELMSVLCVPEQDRNEFLSILSELCEEGTVIKTKRGRYEPNKGGHIVTGIISCSSYGFFAFLTPDSEDEKDVYINGDYLNHALHNDRVAAVIDKTDTISGRAEGHVLKILEHANKTISGVVKRKKGNSFEIRPDSPKIYTTVTVSENDIMDAAAGDRVLVEITKYSPPETIGIVTNVLGDSKDLKSNIAAILFEENINTEFDAETIEQAENIPDKISEEDIKGRLDLRGKLIFTIDGDDARDFDDAVSIDILDNGNYRLGVHIADVTHYVREGSPLDNEAFFRGTSIYLPDRVIPMLPKRLSNGICSLNPHEDRLTLTVFMEISPSGTICAHELHKSVIHSRERMTYSNITRLLESPSKELLAKYEYLLPALRDMEMLASALRKKRMERGSIDFDFPESEIVTDDNGEPRDIVRVKREISHKIIEDFMLAANETVAEYAFWSEIPFVYRVHESPSAESMRDFQRFISAFGLGIKEKFNEDEPIHPKALQQVLSAAAGMEEEHMISVYTLRSLMKAEYKSENLGHFGLAAKYYCHFTSPIRRYPDLAIHRILKDFIDGKPVGKYLSFVSAASKHSSETERKAQLIERDVCDLMKAYYMSQYIGYIFDARISSITEFGMFAELENTVEGLIRIENLKDDFYIFDQEKRIFYGKHSGITYKIGDPIEIAVARCDIMTRQIDFIPAKDATMFEIDALQKKAFKHQRERQKKIRNAASQSSRRKKRPGKKFRRHN